MTKLIEISSLVTEGLQTRDGLAKAVVKDYAETLKAGKSLPPVTVVCVNRPDADGSARPLYYLVDGYHRKDAAILAGRTTIDAEITEGTFTDAVRLAIKANAAHGLRRTNADKRNALKLAWENRQELFGGDPSKTVLAEACEVSLSTVKRFYKTLAGGAKEPPCARVGKDGKSYRAPTTNYQLPANQLPSNQLPATDRYGVAIPERIARAFGSKELDTIVTGLRRLKASIEEKISAEDFAYCKVSQSTLISLGNVIGDLRLETPWCVCRQCGGRGCHACGNTGVQTKLEYERNPKELRPDA